jgi:hypothetical protein
MMKGYVAVPICHPTGKLTAYIWITEAKFPNRLRKNHRLRFGLDRDFAVDELAVVYPILNAIFDPIPIVAEEADSFVRGRIG